MTAAVIGRPDPPRLDRSPVCSACGDGLNHQNIHTGNICPKCERAFCDSCHNLKLELDLSSGRKPSADSCGTCEQIVTIKKGYISSDETHRNEWADRSNLSFQTLVPVIKPVHVAEGKPQNLKNETHKPHSNSDESSPVAQLENETDSSSGSNTTNQFMTKRNNRELYSKSGVPNVIDNRYYYLNPKSGPSETPTADIAMSNFALKRSVVPQRSPPNLPTSKISRHPKGKITNESGNELERGLYNEKRVQNNHLLNRTTQSEKDEAGRRPNGGHLQKSVNHSEQGAAIWKQGNYTNRNNTFFHKTVQLEQNEATRSSGHLQNSLNQSEQGATYWGAENFPQNSQFYNKTIVYPSSTERFPYTGPRKSAGIGHKNEQSHSANSSGDPNNSFQHNNGASQVRSSYKKRQRVLPSAKFDKGMPFDDTLTKDDIEDFYDLDDVPAYDEIPYALIMTGNVDAKTLLRAKRKQMQQMALESIKWKADKSKLGEKINKNKTQGTFVSKSSANRTETYKEQILANRKQHTEEGFQNHVGSSVGISDISTQSGDEIFQKEDTNPSISANSNVAETVGNKLHRPSDETRIPTAADKTTLEDTMNKGSKNVLKGTDEFEKQDRDIECQHSPVHATQKKEYRETSFLARHDMEKANKREKKSANTDSEKHRIESEHAKFIREKRLEMLKAKETSYTNKTEKKTQKHKLDNREMAFHSDIEHKPVKLTAFRSKIPNFRGDIDTQHKKTDATESSKRIINLTNQAIPPKSISTSSTQEPKLYTQIEATKVQQRKVVPTITSSQVTNTSLETSVRDKHNDLESVVELKGTSKDSTIDEAQVDKESSDEDVEPTAMKFLRKHGKKGQMEHPRNFDKPKSMGHSYNDEDMVEPIAMRLLRQSKEAKEKRETKKATKGGLLQDGYGDLLSFLLGGDPDFPPGSKSNTSRISERGVDSIQSKQVKKNKNKNMPPLAQKGQESSAEESEKIENSKQRLLYVFGVRKQPVDKEAADENGSQDVLMSESSSLHKYSMKPVALIEIADDRHKAFKKMKMSQSEDHLKCTSCGRPECQGDNLKKMKEIIRMAKQAGFEVRDVKPDGNCMFAAVVDQLQLYGDYRFGPKSLREVAVSWLIEHPYSDDGTHYASFLAENWETYLQRMMAEGEWGDHLILRAIVETIGHTIKVLNVSGEESHWTILEPASIDASKDGMHLVLGHIGEFHYTSLRPADNKSGAFVSSPVSPTLQNPHVAVDDGQIVLEGTETVDMFREDYIDTLSDMPSVHFSYLLKHVIPVKVVNSGAILQSQYTDNLGDFPLTQDGTLLETGVEVGGSVAEGVFVPHLNALIKEDSSVIDNVDIDIYSVMKKYSVLEVKSGGMLGGGKVECVIDTTGVHSGYTKLLITQLLYGGIDEYSTYLPQIKMTRSEVDENRYRSSNDGLAHIYYKQYSAIRCPVWPECAKPWVSRVRREGWPSQDIICLIESEGCLLLPEAHKESKNPDVEWHFSFAICERKLFRDAVSLYQKYCYILFDALCTQTMHHLKSISSTHLKSVFFYACERIPAEYWESNPGACVFYMMDELLRYVKAKNLPNFFVRANNMVDHLAEKDFKEIEEQIILLRSQPVLFLRQINESLGMLPFGNTVIDKVTDDIPKFKIHKSFKRSTLEVFIQATIDTAHYYIRRCSFEQGYELLSQAFQERLSVSTCDDSVPFQIFLPGAVSGLDLDSLVWFSAYTDKQLGGQLSKSLVRETCGDLQLVKIKDILPADVVGSYGNTEVPADFMTRICSFCHDFAKFLFHSNKLSEILPVLHYCHDIFVKKLKNTETLHAAEGRGDKEMVDTDFTDEAMFDIYTAMHTVYMKQQQMEFFRTVVPVVDAIVGRIRKRWAYNCLCFMYENLGDLAKLTQSEGIYHHLPEDPTEKTRVCAFLYWPYKVKTSVYN